MFDKLTRAAPPSVDTNAASTFPGAKNPCHNHVADQRGRSDEFESGSDHPDKRLDGFAGDITENTK